MAAAAEALAVRLESFSIREYTANIRSVDVGKCWPFDGVTRDRKLPPIACRKYRWWSTELQIARSACTREEGNLDAAGLVVVDVPDAAAATGFEAEKVAIRETRAGPESARSDEDLTAEVVPVDRHMDGCPAEPASEEGRQTKSDGKVKMRTPKKRSIVELFAVAPPIEMIEEEMDDADGDEEGEEEKEENVLEKDGQEEVGGDALDEEVGEAPRKRKEESVEILMRKKNKKKNLVKYKKKKKIKEKHKRKKPKLGICVAIKEKIHKLHLSPQVNYSRYLQESVLRKCLGNEISNPVGTRKKKPATVKGLPKQNKLKVIQTTKLVSKQQQTDPTVYPIHSILKNRTRVSSAENENAINNLHRGMLSKLHQAQQPEKHVSFSGKDDILGHKKKHCSPKELPQMQSLCKAYLDVLSASSILDRTTDVDKQPHATDEAQVVIENENDVTVSITEERAGQSLPEEKQFTDSHGHATPPMSIDSYNSHGLEKTTVGESVDLNHDLQISSSLNWFDPCSSILPLHQSCSVNVNGLNSIAKQGFESGAGNHASEIVPSNPDASRNLPKSFANCVSRSATMSSLTAITRNSSLQSSTSCLGVNLEPNERQTYLLREPGKDGCRHVSQLQQFCHLSPKDLMSSICSSVGSKKQLPQKNVKFGESKLRAGPASVCKDKFLNEDFIGLPLNSQGELINSNAKVGNNHLFKKQNTVLNSVSSFPVQNLVEPKGHMDHLKRKGKFPGSAAHVKDQLKWFPEHYYLKHQSANTSLIAGSGFTAGQDIGRTEIQGQEFVREYDRFASYPLSEPNPMRVTCHGWKEYKQPHNHNDREKIQAERDFDPCFHPTIQPTMRLMGKTLTVGRSNQECQGLDDGKIWTDKEIVTEHSSTVRESDKSIPKDWSQLEWVAHPASGASKENLLQPVQNQKSPNMPSFYRMTTVDPRFDHRHLDCRPRWMSRNGTSSVSENLGSRVDSFSNPHLPHTLLNKTSMNPENHNSATESGKMCYQPVAGSNPVGASNPYNVCQHMLSSTHCKHTQSLSYSMTSTYPPRLPNWDRGKYVQSSLAQCPTPNMPQWLLNATQKKKNTNSCLSYSESISKSHPCAMSGTNPSSLPLPHPTSFISFPVYSPNTPQTCLPNLQTPASFVHSSFIPAFSAIKSTSASNASIQNKCKNMEGMKSNYTCFKGSDHGKKCKKRPASKADEFMKRMKKPNLRMLDDSNDLTGSGKREQLDGCSNYTTGALEPHAHADKIADVNCMVKDGFINASGDSSFKLGGGSRSGPVKLSAGAKHILKPSQNIDLDNSKPTHSTIPFVMGTSGKVPVSQKKSAKIYQF